MRIEKDSENKIHMLIGMVVIVTIVLIISLFVYMKYQADLKKAIEEEKEIALKVVNAIEASVGQQMQIDPTHMAPATCEIDNDGKICNNKEKNISYNINVDSEKLPSGGLIRLTNSGITPSTTINFKSRTYTLQIDDTFELN